MDLLDLMNLVGLETYLRGYVAEVSLNVQDNSPGY